MSGNIQNDDQAHDRQRQQCSHIFIFHNFSIWLFVFGRRQSAPALSFKCLDRIFDHFAGFTGAFLNPADQFVLLAFGVKEIVVRELRPFLFQLALGDFPVAFDFECCHKFCVLVLSVWFGEIDRG